MADRASDTIELLVDGTRFSGWKSISVELDLDAGASAFTLGVTKRDPVRNEDWRIEAGKACKVNIGGETVIDGYVDRAEAALEGSSHAITVSGRSKTADLIDCSAIAKPGSWKKRKLEDIANELAKPFGITFKAEADTGGPIRQFALQSGETVWEAIARAAKQRGILPVPARDGNVRLLLPKIAGGSVRLVEGENLRAVSGFHDVTDRFSQYIAKGQSAGDDEINGKAASQPKAEERDPSVARYRPLIIVADEQSDAATLKKRAKWEVTSRAAKAQGAEATVDGWRRDDGQLWDFMQGVDLDAPAVWISDTLMVAGVRFEEDDQGRQTVLRLVRPEAYTQEPVPPEAKASKIKRSSRKSRAEKTREEAAK